MAEMRFVFPLFFWYDIKLLAVYLNRRSVEDLGQNHSLFYTIKQIYKDLETISCMGFEVFLCCGARTKAGDWLLGAAGRGWTTAGAGDDKNCGAIKEIRIFMANRKN